MCSKLRILHRLKCKPVTRGICISLLLMFCVIASLILGYATVIVANEKSVQQVIILFRHGDRNPTETYPNDPYINFPWKNGWGALTKSGMRRLYDLGEWLRSRYGYLNHYKYESNNTYVYSSYSDRCIMSAQALLAGLYPPVEENIFVEGLHWQPIPVHYTPRHLDKIITVKAPCPVLENELRIAYANNTKYSGEQMQQYYEQLSKYTGKQITNITDVEFLYNTLEIEDMHGLELPVWTRNFYNSKMRTLAAKSLTIFTSNTLQKRLRGGPLLKQILMHMVNFKNKKDTRPMYLYGVHDITLVNVLRTLGISEYRQQMLKPGYGATLVFQLHKYETGIEEVKLLYMDDSNERELDQLSIPLCSGICLLDDVINGYKHVLPENWDEECIVR